MPSASSCLPACTSGRCKTNLDLSIPTTTLGQTFAAEVGRRAPSHYMPHSHLDGSPGGGHAEQHAIAVHADLQHGIRRQPVCELNVDAKENKLPINTSVHHAVLLVCRPSARAAAHPPPCTSPQGCGRVPPTCLQWARGQKQSASAVPRSQASAHGHPSASASWPRTGVVCDAWVHLGADAPRHRLQEHGAHIDERLVHLQWPREGQGQDSKSATLWRLIQQHHVAPAFSSHLPICRCM